MSVRVIEGGATVPGRLVVAVALMALLPSLVGCSRAGLAPPPPREDFCFEVTPERRAEGELELTVEVQRADVLFLVDNTASMADEILRIGEGLERLTIPGIRNAIEDANFGIATVADFSSDPDERAYRLLAPMTTNAGAVAAEARKIELENGSDTVEAQLEALYQVATGEGLGTAIAPAPPCPAGRVGGVCFRPDATRIVLLFTDDGMRGALVSPASTQGTPRASYREPSLDMVRVIPRVRKVEESLAALARLNIRVIGLWSEDPEKRERADLVHVATATGALDRLGRPLVFDIGQEGETLNSGVVEAVRGLTAGVRPDVFLRLEPTGELPPGLIAAVWAQALTGEAGQVSTDGTHFVGVSPGANVRFVVDLDGAGLAPTDQPRRFRLRATLEDEAGARLGRADILVVVLDRFGRGGCKRSSGAVDTSAF